MYSKNQFMKILIAIIMLISVTTIANANQIIWTAVFSNSSPIKPNVSLEYCKSHIPTVMVTTIKQITSKEGVMALNGINVRYLSYKTEKKDDLYFNLVNAMISGKDAEGKSWSAPMKLYEQTLSEVGVTWTVWSTPECKGTFLGTPTLTK